MAIGHPFSKIRIKRPGGSGPPPVVVPVIEYNPNFVLLLASGVMALTSYGVTQRAKVVSDVIDIRTVTGGDVAPDIGCNVSWNAAEDTLDFPGIGNYDWARFDLIKSMAEAAGCKWWVKLFHRNYDGTATTSTPIVPRYMQEQLGGAPNLYKGLTGGSGISANGEYEGTLGAGSNTGARTRAAKLWVPVVAGRLEAWLKAIGVRYNNTASFAGVIINETSPLNAFINTQTGMFVPGKPAGVIPTEDGDTMYDYFQNLFGAVVAARSSLSKKELMISANSPIAPIGGYPTTMYTMLPLNPSVLYTQHKVGNLVQDSWAAGDINPKNSVRQQFINNQPYAINASSYACLLSPDTRRHKGVQGSEYYSATSVNPATGIPGNKIITVKTSSAAGAGFPTLTNDTMKLGKSIVLLHDVNKATEAVIFGTISAYDPLTGQCTVNATSASGTGARTGWEVGIPQVQGQPNYLPPHTLDQLIEYAVTPRLPSVMPGPTHPNWSPTSDHEFKGSTHVFFQITRADTGTSEGELNYVEYVNYLKTTSRRVNTTRPALYPT